MQQEDLLYEAFFQRNARYYLHKLEQERNGLKFTFNLYAFFFGFFWFLYRKMYVTAFLLAIILIAEGIAESYLLAFMDDQTIVSPITWGMNIIIWTTIGFTANYLYLRKAAAVIASTNGSDLPDDVVHQHIKAKGGNSYIFLLPIVLIITGFLLYNNFGWSS